MCDNYPDLEAPMRISMPSGGVYPPPPFPNPGTLPGQFLLTAREGQVIGDFHCKAGRQEVDWKPGLSPVSLSTRHKARPTHCQQAQLRQSLPWPIVRGGLQVFTA